ncbi:MAG: substrate-binding domain-containing protein [Opitutales bacterium]|nr:substrate-binding domain-containing protein [Opitutales bacterium]MCH8541584.1 substrate-binding domain-containing protein [Opitutales bacterium]
MVNNQLTSENIIVGVHLNLALGFHSQIAQGILRFRNTRRNWSFIHLRPEYVASEPLPIVGWIGHLDEPGTTPQNIRDAESIHLINISNRSANPFPGTRIINDDRAIGRMAARYFLRKNFRHFAVWGLPEHNFSAERQLGFQETLAENGVNELSFYSYKDRANLASLRHQLPLALFVVSDIPAKSLMGYLLREGFRIPHDIALLGVDNDPHITLFTSISLSSIITDGESIGFQACEQLEILLREEKNQPKTLRIPPRGIQERFSTETLAIKDQRVQQIQDYMLTHLAEIQNIDEVAQALHIHRRHLDRCFISELQITPAEWLARKRMERAQELLVQSNDTVDIIAERTGFGDRRRLNRTFRKYAQPRPSEIRANQKQQPSDNLPQ